MADAAQIAAGLTELQQKAVLRCEQEGNGAHLYQIHGLAKLGLMALQPVPKLQMAEAYRLTPLGLAVRAHLEADQSNISQETK